MSEATERGEGVSPSDGRDIFENSGLKTAFSCTLKAIIRGGGVGYVKTNNLRLGARALVPLRYASLVIMVNYSDLKWWLQDTHVIRNEMDITCNYSRLYMFSRRLELLVILKKLNLFY